MRASEAVEGKQSISYYICYYRVGSAIVRVGEPKTDACDTLGMADMHTEDRLSEALVSI